VKREVRLDQEHRSSEHSIKLMVSHVEERVRKIVKAKERIVDAYME